MTNKINILQTLEAEKDKLFQYANYRLNNIKDVEDVLQNLYVKILTNKHIFTNISNLRAYFYRMVSNDCNDILRESIKMNTMSIDSLTNTDIESLQPENFDEEFIIINRLLNMLPIEQSETIRYRLHCDLAFQEIADIMEVPLSTAKARYRYGIEKIKTNLKKENLL
ncbi:MAG: RNA polymerase sigma factor [Muribaculaceae bacterium]|nr:RNA polymerase sigma factor [Muribaculaceae bacterium]